MGKDSPKQADPSALMGQQSALNRLNTVTPYGNITYTGSQTVRVPGGSDLKNQPTGMRVDLSPQQQGILNSQQAAQAHMAYRGNQLANLFPMTPAGQFSPTFQGPQAQFSPTIGGQQAAFAPTMGDTPQRAFAPTLGDTTQRAFAPTFEGPQAAFAPGDFEASRAAAERAVFDRGMSLLRPEFEREDARLQQRLANQGLPQASRAYTSETESAARSRAEQMDRLAQSAVLQGLGAQQQGYAQALGTFGAEEGRRAQEFGRDVTRYQTEAQRRQQIFGEDLTRYQTEAQRRQQLFGEDLTRYQTEAGRRAQQYGQDLSGYQAEATRRAQQFGQDLSGYQANQAQRAGQLQEILGLFGLQGVQLPQMQGAPQIDVPYQQQQQGSAGLMPGLLALGGAGLGAAYGGPAGAAFGFQAGGALPGMFGY